MMQRLIYQCLPEMEKAGRCLRHFPSIDVLKHVVLEITPWSDTDSSLNATRLT